MVSQERSAEITRAVERAKAVLRVGDRILIGTCGNSRGSTITMTGWSADFPGFLTSKTLDGDELHPINIRKVNGVPTDFSDAGA